jgi:hypothetical protein
MDYFLIVSGLAFTALFVLVMRLIGAWMLRIDEVISNQKKIIEELKKANSENNQNL